MRRFVLVGIFLAVSVLGLGGLAQAEDTEGRLITVYDRGAKQVFLTHEKTLKQALNAQHITVDTHDAVEPSLDEELVAPDYHVNIYRARPVVVVDGPVRVKTVSAFQTAPHIARDAGITVYPEDIATLKPLTDFIGDGAGLEMSIKRATPFILDLYGKKTEVRTQAKTVGAMIAEKKITLSQDDRVSLPNATPIAAGLEVRIWREGKQTVTFDEPVPFETQQIFDADRQVGYRQVQTPGVLGMQAVTYEIEIKDGVELSRTLISRFDTKAPKNEVVIVGIKTGPGSLTKSKGAQYFVDSRGVVHRETYYDLDMGVVMQACGQGGYYTVRVDGVKVDRDGYVIIAANYARYPRCSVVETSVGPGKVYDTGGFAAVHPDGFDLATDWTNYNDR